MINFEINKSFKVEGAVAIHKFGQHNWSIRKPYTTKEGKMAVRVENVEYTFEYAADGIKGINIEEYKPAAIKAHKSISESIKEEAAKTNPVITPVELPKEDDSKEVYHEKYELIKTMIQENIPVYLVGPAGSGKNHTLEQISWDLNLDFYFTNSIQQEYKLTGFVSPKLNGEDVYVETEFYRAFTKGGLFFLDEMDASIPEVLVLLNAAIANKYFEFPGKGRIEAHEKFRVVAAGNTFGNGADEQYTGRLTLDQATLDRFAVIEFDYSLKIELHLAKGNIELVNFIHELRKQANEKGIRATFSYRSITMVTKLEGKISLEDILKTTIFKGMDKDTLNTFMQNGQTSKYFQALKKIQVA